MNLIKSGKFARDVNGGAAKTQQTVPETLPKSSVPYTVRVKIDNLNIRAGAGTGYAVNGTCPPGVYTIVEEKQGSGGWGKLKSGKGWIALSYAERI